eukprot:PLAT5320.1.p1 GENE.PLAT5320.1~~PLAT5320.1.p1  ORF type:complete len:725 (-),score=393.27 PLAT5320.1:96-2198(-)
MGNEIGRCLHLLSGDDMPPVYNISVYTSDVKGAGTNGDVSLVLHSEDGKTTKALRLRHLLRDNFERGKVDMFQVEAESIGALAAVEVTLGPGMAWGPDWHLDKITVGDSVSEWTFPYYRWITNDSTALILSSRTAVAESCTEYVAGLRKALLEERRGIYQWEEGPRDKDTGRPLMPRGMRATYKQLPRDERFPDVRDKDFKMAALSAVVSSKLGELATVLEPWDDLEDFDKLYTVLARPAVAERWRSDHEFVRQLLQGLHPTYFRRAAELPPGMSVDGVPLALPEGTTFADELAAGRIFMLDYRDMESLPLRPLSEEAEAKGEEGQRVGPVALFHAHCIAEEELPLRILAIQLQTDGPVYTPAASSNIDWMTARLYLVVADGAQHQIGSHYLCTHAVMEPFAVATHRQLSCMHPVFKLLLPHLKGTIAINALASDTLVAPGGIIETVFMLGKNSIPLAMKRFETWDMMLQSFDKTVEDRGVGVSEALPEGSYPWRDDASMTWDAMVTLTNDFIALYYADDAAVAADSELAAWWADLVDNGFEGAKLPYDTLTTVEELKRVVLTVMWTASILHGTLNFGQFEYQGYPPNRPSLLRVPVPKEARPSLDEAKLDDALVAALPTKAQSVQAIVTSYTLSSYTDNEVYIKDLPKEARYEPDELAIFAKFQEALAAAEEEIAKRNAKRTVVYPHARPSKVPTSIAI